MPDTRRRATRVVGTVACRASGTGSAYNQIEDCGAVPEVSAESDRVVALVGREMAGYIERTEQVTVSHHYVAKLWREHNLRPHRQGTFKISKDPQFAAKVADIVGLYLDPPGGAVVLSLDEKTQVQALDRTQPILPVAFDKTEKRTHDYVRHGTTNLFAAMDVGTGEVVGQCKPTRNGADFLAFGKRVVRPHRDKEIHIVLDNLSTHTTPDVEAWLNKNPERGLPLHPGRIIVDEPNRELVLHHHPASHPTRHLQLRRFPDRTDQRLHRYLEHQPRPPSPGPQPPTRSLPRSNSSRPTSNNSSPTTRKASRITRH